MAPRRRRGALAVALFVAFGGGWLTNEARHGSEPERPAPIECVVTVEKNPEISLVSATPGVDGPRCNEAKASLSELYGFSVDDFGNVGPEPPCECVGRHGPTRGEIIRCGDPHAACDDSVAAECERRWPSFACR